MSRDTYFIGLQIAAKDYPFYALIQAAMRQADTANLQRLKQAWPEIWDELQARCNAPAGCLSGEPIPEDRGDRE